VGKKVLLINFGGAAERKSVEVWMDLVANGIAAEVYPDSAKAAKQFKYADQAGFGFAIAIGDQELETGTCNVKSLSTGVQQSMPLTSLVDYLQLTLAIEQ
jgi:histidyl-tRNA synthetase